VKQTIFIDSNVLCGLFNDKDALHEKSKKAITSLTKSRFTISNFILLECYTIISQRTFKVNAINFRQYMTSSDQYNLFWISRKLEEDSWNTFSSIRDKNFSYVDASILAVMKSEKITHLLSFDTGFIPLQRKFDFTLIGI
jgi:predicted nucleic acid-binding protein